MTIDRMEEFEMGRVVSRAVSVLMRNAGIFLALAGMLTAPILLVTFYFVRNNPILAGVQNARPAVAAGVLGASLLNSLVTIFVSVVFAYVLQAALVQGTVTDLNGERPSLGNCLSTGFKSFLPLIAIALLAYFGMMLGFVLLVVPGFIVALMWSVVVPVRVVEHTGVLESFGRSRALTKGSRWKILGLVAIYIVIAFLVQMVLALLSGTSLVRPNLAALSTVYIVGSWILRIPFAALAAVGIASVYYELRLVKEGVGPQQLAAAFD